MAELSSAEKLRLKRELRRQKILDNAENRMRFVSGRTKTLEAENQTQEIPSVDAERRENSGSYKANRLARENDSREEKQTELTRSGPAVNEFESNETSMARHRLDTQESAGQSDVLTSGDATREQAPYEFFILSPLVRVLIVFLAGLSYYVAQSHPVIVQHLGIKPSWFGQSIVYGFLSLYIPAILVVISTRMRRFIGVRFSKRTDLALAVLSYASAFTGIPVNVDKWMLWVFMLTYNTVTDLGATLFLFFLLLL